MTLEELLQGLAEVKQKADALEALVKSTEDSSVLDLLGDLESVCQAVAMAKFMELIGEYFAVSVSVRDLSSK